MIVDLQDVEFVYHPNHVIHDSAFIVCPIQMV